MCIRDRLSGGQRQRVALARAFVFGPRILLMDEPLSALDKKLREQMQIELKQLHRKLGVTTVYVTHDQREALTMSDRIAVINEGKIEQLGTPKEIYNSPNSSFVADFIGESSFLQLNRKGNDLYFSSEKIITNKKLNKNISIIISDSMTRPYRLGVTNFALASSNIQSLIDLSGTTDMYGKSLKHTEIAVADEIASAAGILMGQSDEMKPIILLKGFDMNQYEINDAFNLTVNNEDDLYR